MIIVRPIAEPPFVEDPQPTFGVVIQKLNDITIQAEERQLEFNRNIAEKLDQLDAHVTAWINGTIAPIDAHLALRGAVHGENKATVGLSKKDNFRTATKAEQIAYANVNAFVTPEGAKASIEANTGNFDLSLYQRNGVFQFASYYYPDDYPSSPPAAPEPPRFMTQNGRVPILVNGDRLLLSPRSDEARYTRQSLFLSLPYKGQARSRLSEIINQVVRYTGTNWNMTGADISDGTVGFFRPLADKQIYNFSTTLPLPVGNRNYLLFNRFANTTYKGLGVTAKLTGGVLTINHRFFYVNAVETAPSMTELVNATYMAQFDKMGGTAVAPANGAHTYNLLDFITLPAGATIAVDPGYPDAITTLVWNSIDYEAYLNINVPVIVTLAGKQSKLVWSFTESIIPGSLVAGGTAAFKTLGSRVKDVLPSTLIPDASANFFTLNNPFDFNNIVQSPGVVLGSGLVVKSVSTKLGVRVKRYQTAYNGIKDWMMAKRPVVSPADASTEVFAPSRHSPFGPIPERIIPVANDANITQYLAYGLDPATGLFSWSQLTWNNTSIIGAVTGDGTFGIKLPEIRDQVDNLGLMPKSIATLVNQPGVGGGSNALCFTNNNQFIGKASFSYNNKTLTVGADVTMAASTKLSLQAVARGVVDRAKILNPGIDHSLRVPQIQVFAVTATKALIVISDGVSYAEAAAALYTVAGGVFTMDFKPTNGVALKRVTPASNSVTGTKRVSGSGDNVWMGYSDLQIVQVSTNTFNFVVTRPFGDVYGDVSFQANGFVTGSFPTFIPGKVNPARLYAGTQQIDLVEELLPPLLVYGKGVYQYDSANTAFTNTMNEVGGGTTKTDLFNINEAGWVRIPAGGRVMLGGKAYVLGDEFALKVNPAGTTYCYLIRNGDVLTVAASSVRREVGNNEVLFGIAVNGVLTQTKDYLVMSNHVVSASRRGTAIPCFADNGVDGVNQFFTRRDVF